MKLKNIKLINFRSYSNLNLEFNDNVNIIIGNNGVGKTNILESVYVLSLTKSNRFGNDENLIKFGCDSFKVEGEVLGEDFPKKFSVINKNGKKSVYINSKEIRRISDYISNFCVISFLPNDLEIIKGSPLLRRTFLNIEISQLYNNYVNCLNEYNTILKMRNDYLKKLNINGNSDKRYLNVLDEHIAEKATLIYKYRFDYIDNVNCYIKDIFNKITGIEDLRIEFVNNLGITKYDEGIIKETILNKLKKNYNQEIILGNTLVGPHRDDFKFVCRDNDMKLFSSQGEQRMAIISFKLAEIFMFKRIKNIYPVLLLDDIFSEIDIKKRNKIIKYLNKDIQTIITTTDLNNIDSKLLNNAKIFNIKNGIIKEKVGIRCKKKK